MEESSKMNPNPTNDSDHFEPDLKPGMQLTTTQGCHSKGITKRNVCKESSGSESQTKHQQSQKKSHCFSNRLMMEDVMAFYNTSKKAGSETGVSALTLLSEEMWLKIFQHGVSTDGPLPFLLRAGGVCRAWRDVTQEPVLWRKLDMTCEGIKGNSDCLEWLIYNRLSYCKEIIFVDWNFVTEKATELIARHCPQLQTIDLSESSVLSEGGVTALFENCQKLRKVNLPCKMRIAVPSIAKHLRKRFQRSSLKCQNLSGSGMDDFSSSFEEIVVLLSEAMKISDEGKKMGEKCGEIKLIRQTTKQTQLECFAQQCLACGATSNCPQLEELNFGCMCCPLEIFNRQRCSPPCVHRASLHVHRFDVASFCIRHSAQAQTNGLVQLEELRFGRYTGLTYCLNFTGNRLLDFLIPRLLLNSAQLKVLEVSGYPVFNASILLSLPVEALENLTMSRIRAHGHVLKEIFRKWRHSLTTVTLNTVVGLETSELEAAVEILTDLPTCPLRELSLLHTKTSLSCVKMLTSGKLKNMQVLDLNSSILHTQFSRRYEGQAALRQLACDVEREDACP